MYIFIYLFFCDFFSLSAAPVFKREDPDDSTSIELKAMNPNKTEIETASYFCSPNAVPDASSRISMSKNN